MNSTPEILPDPAPTRRSERLALLATVLILVGLPLAVLGYQYLLRPALSGIRTIEVVAAAPEAGGFQPDSLRVAAGETVRLRFTVPDVTHGIAIGPGVGIDLGQIDPGEVKEVEVVFDRPGRYTLYCNTWCSPNHWRMRAAIEVYDPANPAALVTGDPSDPVIESLAARQVDIDAPHQARVIPVAMPSAERGAELVARLGPRLPPELADLAGRRRHSPVAGWELLVKAGLSEGQAWDAVAYLWLSNIEPETFQTAAMLYAKNCAACHGESGDGQGPGAAALAAQGLGQHSDMQMGSGPPAFNEPLSMLGGTGEIYYAKLRRGGMGTGMPAFGPIFTPEETWQLVDYLWMFVFEAKAD